MGIMKYEISFEAPDDWEPLQVGCIQECPLSAIMHLGGTCHAKDVWDRYRDIVCPLVRYYKGNVEIKLRKSE